MKTELENMKTIIDDRYRADIFSVKFISIKVLPATKRGINFCYHPNVCGVFIVSR